MSDGDRRRRPRRRRRSKERVRANAAAAVVGLVLAAGSGGIAATTDDAPQPPRSAVVAGAVQELLGQLEVGEELPRAGFDRELFRHWVDVDDNGCDTRQEVLIAERVAGETDECRVVAGRWESLYDDVTVTDPRRIDIDHVVALGEAWDSGAANWSEEERERFANDLGYRDSLIAVTAGSNRSKSDRDPAEWVPPDESSWCRFAVAWTTVKVRWGLTADAAEVAALRELFGRCRSAPPTAVARAG
jgi:hypothetical protein